MGILIASIVLFIFYIFAAGSIGTDLMMRINNSEGFILVSTSFLNSIIFIVTSALTVALFVIYFMFRKHFNNHRNIYGLYGVVTGTDYKRDKSNKAYKLIFTVMISGSILGYLYSINNFYVLLDNKIEKHNIISSLKHTYSYNDIKEISIGVKDIGRYGGSLYYKIIFRDNNVINIANDYISIEGDPLQSVKKFNEVVKSDKIKRTIDKTHFHDLVENLGEEYVKEYGKLFTE